MIPQIGCVPKLHTDFSQSNKDTPDCNSYVQSTPVHIISFVHSNLSTIIDMTKELPQDIRGKMVDLGKVEMRYNNISKKLGENY